MTVYIEGQNGIFGVTREPFCCTPYEENDWGLIDQVSGQAHLFSAQEIAKLSRLLPKFEGMIGEVTWIESTQTCEPDTIAADCWNHGMSEFDASQYRKDLYPLIINEIKRLRISSGSLVCEPACNEGNLLELVRSNFSHLRVVGSDLNPTVVGLAKRRTSNIPIHVADARSLNYLKDEEVHLFLCSGLLAFQVVTKRTAEDILKKLHQKLKIGGKIIVCGKTNPHFRETDYLSMGFRVLNRVKWYGEFFLPFFVLEK